MGIWQLPNDVRVSGKGKVWRRDSESMREKKWKWERVHCDCMWFSVQTMMIFRTEIRYCKEWCIAALLPENNFLSKQNMSIMQINDIAITRKEHVAKCKRTELWVEPNWTRNGKWKESVSRSKRANVHWQSRRHYYCCRQSEREDNMRHITTRITTANNKKWSNKSRSYESKLC